MTPLLNGKGPVLVVDDSPQALRITELVFQESEVSNEVILFGSGADVLNHLEFVSRKLAEMPSMVLLDINMPDPNGFEVLRRVRQIESFRPIPIVMLTSSNDDQDMQRSFEAGADAYQVKPFGIDEYLGFVNSLVPPAIAGQ